MKSAAFTVDFSNAEWKFALFMALSYLTMPIAMPVCILMSRILRRSVSLYPHTLPDPPPQPHEEVASDKLSETAPSQS